MTVIRTVVLSSCNITIFKVHGEMSLTFHIYLFNTWGAFNTCGNNIILFEMQIIQMLICAEIV